ncbi:MAG: helix-turn-helix domain-containing protein, partial [Pseudomonadota bacterium]|nr:helix-turn-helix domain-containing protein [Pseudomonadota bacterium]
MSNHLISEVYKRQVGNISRNAVMVLMADKASDDGSGIWASKQRMADELGASKQTVITTIRALIEDGLIRQRGQRRCANGYTVEYAINVTALRALPLVGSHAEDQSENLTGQNLEPVKKADPTGQIPLPHQSENLTQTLLEPSLNPSDTSYP